MTGHLLYWGKATVIYPVCTSNLYIVSPTVPNPHSRELAEKFSERFSGSGSGGYSLAYYLSKFTNPNSIAQVRKG